MRHCPDGTYKWIGHCMDHWSKFHVLFALCHKSAAEVALNLQNQVFSYLGTPKILHSDNDPEFVNAIVASLCKEWPGLVKSLLSMAAQEILSARALLSRGMGQWRKCWVFVSLNLTQILLLGQNGSPLFSVRCSIACKYAFFFFFFIPNVLTFRSLEHDSSWGHEDHSL